MITLIDEAMENGPIRLDILNKFESKRWQLGKPSNSLVPIYTRCSLFLGPMEADDYILFNVSDVNLGYDISSKAHIAAYLLYVGKRNGKQVQHKCGVRFCSNPDHLTLGLHQKNGQHASQTKAVDDFSKQSWKFSKPTKDKIKLLYWTEKHSIKLLSEMYEVSQSAITRIIIGE